MYLCESDWYTQYGPVKHCVHWKSKSHTPPPNQPASATAWNIKACRTVVPSLFDLASPFELLHAPSTPATIYNCKDVRITTDKIRNTIVSRVGFTVFTFSCKTKHHVYYNQWDDWACICTTSLETPGCMLVRTDLMSKLSSDVVEVKLGGKKAKIQALTQQFCFKNRENPVRKIVYNL